MGKRYFCEYCDRSFKDAQGVRKKHLTSLQHVKNRDLHYSYFKEPEQIVEEEKVKKQCTRFMKTGDCPFGTMCKYSHYTPEMIQQVQAIGVARTEARFKRCDPDPERIIKNYFEDNIDPETVVENDIKLWPLPPEYENIPNLPPSLQPITYKNFKDCLFPEWGWH